MDDNIIEHYTNQSAFLIEISDAATGQYQVTLIEVWEPASNQTPAPVKDETIYSCQFNPSLKALPEHFLKPKRTREKRLLRVLQLNSHLCKYNKLRFLWFCHLNLIL